ncbi:MAG: hypothetical protein ACYTFW_00240 [Planctomycetota bacterium]|jgi:hypothetical protein
MIISWKSAESVNVYRVMSHVFLNAPSPDFGVVKNLDMVLAYGIEQAMQLIEAKYRNAEKYANFEIDSVRLIGSASYIPDLLTAKGVPLRSTE